MRNKDSMKIISIVLSLISLVACLFIWGQLSGFEKGFLYGVFQEPPRQQTGISGSNEPSIFELINTWYFIIISGFCIYIIGNFVKPFVVSSTGDLPPPVPKSIHLEWQKRLIS